MRRYAPRHPRTAWNFRLSSSKNLHSSFVSDGGPAALTPASLLVSPGDQASRSLSSPRHGENGAGRALAPVVPLRMHQGASGYPKATQHQIRARVHDDRASHQPAPGDSLAPCVHRQRNMSVAISLAARCRVSYNCTNSFIVAKSIKEARGGYPWQRRTARPPRSPLRMQTGPLQPRA